VTLSKQKLVAIKGPNVEFYVFYKIKLHYIK
jgi:hypothetical protein